MIPELAGVSPRMGDGLPAEQVPYGLLCSFLQNVRDKGGSCGETKTYTHSSGCREGSVILKYAQLKD